MFQSEFNTGGNKFPLIWHLSKWQTRDLCVEITQHSTVSEHRDQLNAHIYELCLHMKFLSKNRMKCKQQWIII